MPWRRWSEAKLSNVSFGQGMTATTVQLAAALDRFDAKKQLFRGDIRLRYETTAEQLGSILLQIRELLGEHSRVREEASRARFVGLRASSIDIEIFAYVTTSVWTEFLAVQEELLFQIVAIVENNGAKFALPSQTLYLERDASADEGETGLSHRA